jgi:hypothetical protein
MYKLLLCFGCNFKHFVLLLEFKHKGMSSVKTFLPVCSQNRFCTSVEHKTKLLFCCYPLILHSFRTLPIFYVAYVQKETQPSEKCSFRSEWHGRDAPTQSIWITKSAWICRPIFKHSVIWRKKMLECYKLNVTSICFCPIHNIDVRKLICVPHSKISVSWRHT